MFIGPPTPFIHAGQLGLGHTRNTNELTGIFPLSDPLNPKNVRHPCVSREPFRYV